MNMILMAIAYQVYDQTGEVLNLAYIGLATFAPAIGLSLITGYVADLFDRRLIYCSQLWYPRKLSNTFSDV